MAKKKLRSGLELSGIGPNILLKQVENTNPFLFKGEIDTSGPERQYLAKLVFYKINPEAMKNLSLPDYFYLCLAAHWATAGTYVPTDVDNQIREGLWKHELTPKYIETMAKMTIDSWKWDYRQVTNRKSKQMSTHEGTWLSVAIGAYCACDHKDMRNKHPGLAEKIAEVILAEIRKEEADLNELRAERDHLNFFRASALMAHNLGDLDRVIDQWNMPEDHHFRQLIYKLGHKPHPAYSPILVYAGQVNKAFLSVENHRHMSMREPRCLRRSHRFLIPVGPFMDEWGQTLGAAPELTLEEKGQIICAFHEGFTRQDQALGYTRAYRGLVHALPGGLDSLVMHLPADLVASLKKGAFLKAFNTSQEEFENEFKRKLDDFVCPLTSLQF